MKCIKGRKGFIVVLLVGLLFNKFLNLLLAQYHVEDLLRVLRYMTYTPAVQ